MKERRAISITITACIVWTCATLLPNQTLRDGSWWLSLGEWQQNTVVLGYGQCYRAEVAKELTFSEEAAYADRLLQRLKQNDQDRSRSFAELLESEAAKSPPRRTPWQTYMTKDKRGMETGEGWRQLIRPGQRLGFVQGYLECQRRHPKPGVRYSQDELWYVNELSKWYGVREEDETALRPDRENTAIVDALQLLKDK